MKTILSTATALNLINHVNGHSWLACADYTADVNGQDYDDSNCVGYPRDWNTYATSTFGEDRGFNYQLSGTTGTQTWCVTTYDGEASDYTTSYPMSEYATGETVRLLWPAKNHANYECFSNIPDAAMKIYAIKTDDYSESSDLSSWTTVKDWHENGGGGTDGVPFQNCPSFCEDTDKAVCYGDFDIDNNLFDSDDTYTFMWYWEFNVGQVYTTCWDATVSTSGNVIGGVDTPSPTQVGDTPSPTEEAQTQEEYIITVPICYEGATYDADLLESTAEGLFTNVDFIIIGIEEDGDNWNATLYTLTDDAGDVTNAVNFWVYGRSTNDMCVAVVAAFGTGTCSICEDFIVYSATEFGGTGTVTTTPVTTTSTPVTESGANGVRNMLIVAIMVTFGNVVHFMGF